jgi:hypothetical protein
MDERKKVVSTSSTDRGDVGRLVAFVDMKVDELWKNDNTLLEINTGSGKPNAFWCTTGKVQRRNPGKGRSSHWCSKARPAIMSRKCLAV